MDPVSTVVIGYVGKKLLGPTFEKMGADFATLYKNGRDKIIEKATKKVENLDDNSWVNLRITREVFMSGSFTDEDICAEYFGGVLASSRSPDGKNDTSMYYLDVIKSLSSYELKLHYFIYHSLNLMFYNSIYNKDTNIFMNNEVRQKKIYFNANKLVPSIPPENIVQSLHILLNKGLISNFITTTKALTKGLLWYVEVLPTSVGVLTYAIAHNKAALGFTKDYWGTFEGISAPECFANMSQLEQSLDIENL